VVVPKVIGQRAKVARHTLAARGLVVKFTALSDLCAGLPPQGSILLQRPHPGTRVHLRKTVLVQTSCGGSSSEVPPAPPGTGVAGRVIIGPTCPIVTPDCPPAKPARATVRIETAPATRNSGSSRLVESVTSRGNGAFAAKLAPGDYTLIVESAVSGSTLEPTATTVHVAPGTVRHVTLALDTGIR
jgi:beta-lactam-binding protein with PASTA domain